MGYPVRVAQALISSAEYVEWMAYFSLMNDFRTPQKGSIDKDKLPIVDATPAKSPEQIKNILFGTARGLQKR